MLVYFLNMFLLLWLGWALLSIIIIQQYVLDNIIERIVLVFSCERISNITLGLLVFGFKNAVIGIIENVSLLKSKVIESKLPIAVESSYI